MDQKIYAALGGLDKYGVSVKNALLHKYKSDMKESTNFQPVDTSFTVLVFGRCVEANDGTLKVDSRLLRETKSLSSVLVVLYYERR